MSSMEHMGCEMFSVVTIIALRDSWERRESASVSCLRRGEALITTASLVAYRVWTRTISSMEYMGCEMFSLVTIIVLACSI